MKKNNDIARQKFPRGTMKLTGVSYPKDTAGKAKFDDNGKLMVTYSFVVTAAKKGKRK